MQDNDVLQCVYNHTQGISSANDLNTNNEYWKSIRYTRLSQLARQTFLMQSEITTALNVFDSDYQLDYSESYSGTVHQETAIA